MSAQEGKTGHAAQMLGGPSLTPSRHRRLTCNARQARNRLAGRRPVPNHLGDCSTAAAVLVRPQPSRQLPNPLGRSQ
jgi:hypothetical protein